MKKRKIIAGSVLGVLLVIYVGVSIYFTNRFLPGTKLSDRKVAGYTAEKIKSEITDEIHSYVLTIKEREKRRRRSPDPISTLNHSGAARSRT